MGSLQHAAAFSIFKLIVDFQSPVKVCFVAELLLQYSCNSAEHKNRKQVLCVFQLEFLSVPISGYSFQELEH